MGNASAREVGNGHAAAALMEQVAPGGGGSSADAVMQELPLPAPYVFTPQVLVAPLQIPNEFSPVLRHSWASGSDHSTNSNPAEKGIPTLITWSHGGNEVLVEGSWDNWTSRKVLRRSGKDRVILLVLPSGIYRYRFIVNGRPTYDAGQPLETDETGQRVNLLDVHDNVPENLDSLTEFDAPPSPENSYGQQFPADEEFIKEPPALPPQLLMPVLGGSDNSDEHRAKLKPQHVALNHLFIENEWGSQSVLGLGVTHRFQSKHVNFVLYKPRPRR